jgi:hypothetical protein
MQTLSIHDVKTITLSEITSFTKSPNRKAFTVRNLEITDIHGNRMQIDLFGNDTDSLLINGESK